MRNKNKAVKTTIAILMLTGLSLLLLHNVYRWIDYQNEKVVQRTEDYHAEVETPVKKLLNGHLGLFFRFKYMGNINWLALPLVLWFLITGKRKKRERWQLALAFVWVMSVLFIGVKGYSNSRYQLTLFPFTTGVVLLLLWELVKEKTAIVKIVVFSLLAGLTLYNVIHYFPQYKWFWDLKITGETEHFPRKIISFLRSQDDIGRKRNRVFVFNQPIYYYHTDRFGIDFVNPNRIGIFKELKTKNANRNRLHRLIYKRNKVKYIFIGHTTESQYKDRMLSEFLNCECRLLFNEHGIKLYEIRPHPLLQELGNPRFQQVGAARLFTMDLQVKRGTFNFDNNRKKRIMTIQNQTADKDGNRLIQIGYDSELEKYGLQVPQDGYVHLIVEAKISYPLLNKENFLFIRDKKEEEKGWTTTRLYFSSHLWRTYLVTRKIRPGSNRIILGVRFSPKSTEETLSIRNIKAYISHQPL